MSSKNHKHSLHWTKPTGNEPLVRKIHPEIGLSWVRNKCDVEKRKRLLIFFYRQSFASSVDLGRFSASRMCYLTRSSINSMGTTAAPTMPGPVWTPSTGEMRLVSS